MKTEHKPTINFCDNDCRARLCSCGAHIREGEAAEIVGAQPGMCDTEIDAEAIGSKAIIALQSLAGITETENQAQKGWRAMSAREKEQTLRVYKTLFPKPGAV